MHACVLPPAMQAPEFQKVMIPLFRQLSRCLNSQHFQVCGKGGSQGGDSKFESALFWQLLLFGV